ncbi:MAG: hypothetical protein IPI46_02405 [Bacteroidetes bacterium]|nr:hypothetical protein [Bacteroidota bacterium]
MSDAMVYPVEGVWGKQGWTKVLPPLVNKMILHELVVLAYCHVAPKNLSANLAL